MDLNEINAAIEKISKVADKCFMSHYLFAVREAVLHLDDLIKSAAASNASNVASAGGDEEEACAFADALCDLRDVHFKAIGCVYFYFPELKRKLDEEGYNPRLTPKTVSEMLKIIGKEKEALKARLRLPV